MRCKREEVFVWHIYLEKESWRVTSPILFCLIPDENRVKPAETSLVAQGIDRVGEGCLDSLITDSQPSYNESSCGGKKKESNLTVDVDTIGKAPEPAIRSEAGCGPVNDFGHQNPSGEFFGEQDNNSRN